MAQQNGSSKPVRVGVEAQKKAKGDKEEIKLPALSPSKKVKDTPISSKPAPVSTAGAKVLKSMTPKSPSKPSAPITPAKLSAPVKAQPTQAPQQPIGGEAPICSGPDISSVAATEARGPSLSSETMTLDGSGSAIKTEDPVVLAEDLSAGSANPSPNDLAQQLAKAAAAAEEAERLRKLNGNGMVKLIYEQYDELFPIEDGSTTQTNIDEVYCLSFVMPNCFVRLSRHPNIERFQREESGIFDSLLREDPRGTYHDLEKDETYYVVVEQEVDQLRRDQEATKALWNGELQKQKKADRDDGRVFETCSCIYGNPCGDEYGCRDWHSRFAVATKNGWKGF